MHVKTCSKGITMKSLFIASLVTAMVASAPRADAAEILERDPAWLKGEEWGARSLWQPLLDPAAGV